MRCPVGTGCNPRGHQTPLPLCAGQTGEVPVAVRDAWDQSLSLTKDGRVRVVSLPGHTPGHVGVVVTDGAMSIMMVGDATFDLDQSARGGVSGVSTNVGDARTTQRALTALTKNGVVVLPAHDPTVFQRMAAAR